MAEVTEESKLKYNFLGKSGLNVANICLGTMTFGENRLGMWGQTSEELGHQILDRYVQWGGNFIDTADMYSSGNSEKIIGSWLQKQERERFVVVTKCRFPIGTDNPNMVGLCRRHITNSINGSLERLKTVYVDLYQVYEGRSAVIDLEIKNVNAKECSKIVRLSKQTGHWALKGKFEMKTI